MTIHGLDDEVRDKLRIRTAQHGWSMEAEVRAILTGVVESPIERTMTDAPLRMREALGGLELYVPPRTDYARDPFA